MTDEKCACPRRRQSEAEALCASSTMEREHFRKGETRKNGYRTELRKNRAGLGLRVGVGSRSEAPQSAILLLLVILILLVFASSSLAARPNGEHEVRTTRES